MTYQLQSLAILVLIDISKRMIIEFNKKIALFYVFI